MNKLVYIIDDNQSNIDLLKEYVLRTEGLELIGTTTEPVHGLNMIVGGNLKADIIFLDIEMPGQKGTEIAPLLMPFAHVIFTTAFHDYAVLAFDLGMADYLLKPFDYTRFLAAVRKVLEQFQSKGGKQFVTYEQGLFIREGGKIIRISKSDIIMVESQRHIVRIYQADSNHSSYISIGEMEEALKDWNFMRINKSYIINLGMIVNIEGAEVRLKKDYRAIIGPKYREEFFARINSGFIGTK